MGEMPPLLQRPGRVVEGSFSRAAKCTILEKQSTMLRKTILPSDEGKPVTKSKLICDQGRHCHDGQGRRLQIQDLVAELRIEFKGFNNVAEE